MARRVRVEAGNLDMSDFTPTHAHVVHQAMVEAKHEAKERRERMPSSADALERRAAELLIVRNMILDRLPPEHHSHRLAYPDYYVPFGGFEEYDRTRNGGRVMKNIANPD
jgi:hypothetical protein